MFKKVLTASAIVLASSSAMAEWTGGIAYSQMSDDDLDFGLLIGSVGYEIKGEGNFKFVPELRYGVSVDNDMIEGVELKINRFLSLSVRGEYDFKNGAYAFIAPSYTNAELEASANGFSASDDASEFGIGTGLGYFFTEDTAIEASYERIDESDIINVGLKFKF